LLFVGKGWATNVHRGVQGRNTPPRASRFSYGGTSTGQ